MRETDDFEQTMYSARKILFAAVPPSETNLTNSPGNCLNIQYRCDIVVVPQWVYQTKRRSTPFIVKL